MVKNRISQLRKSRGLSQRALAELAETSQQQVQRIEAGIQGVRLELATRIATALGSQIGEVFPFMADRRPAKGLAASRFVLEPEQFVEAGIDPDPVVWTIRFIAHDGRDFFYQVASDEKVRVERSVRDGDTNFVVLTSDTHRVALNLKRIAATQFLFDANDAVVSTEKEPKELELRLHLIASKDPIKFDLEPDLKPMEEDDDGSLSQLQNLFFFLELGLEEDETISFDDVDGERVYLRPTEVLVLEVPLTCCEPELQNAEHEGYMEDEEAKASGGNEKVAE